MKKHKGERERREERRDGKAWEGNSPTKVKVSRIKHRITDLHVSI